MADTAVISAAASGWEPKRRLSLQQARGRSRFLKVFRLACLGLAGGALVTMVGFMIAHSLGGGFEVRTKIEAQEVLTMINPRFDGRDADGSQYVVTAERAVRLGDGSEDVRLVNPRFERPDGQVLTAEEGVYNALDRTLDLKGTVRLALADGSRFETSVARLSARDSMITGAEPIAGESALGEVTADFYELHRSGDRIILRGRVRGVIHERSR